MSSCEKEHIINKYVIIIMINYYYFVVAQILVILQKVHMAGYS